MGDEVERLAAHREMLSWTNQEKMLLQKNDCSRLHRFVDAEKCGRLISGSSPTKLLRTALPHLEHTFVIRHDWAAAFSSADGYVGDHRFPYSKCCFEFRISGRNAIAVCLEEDQWMTVFFEIEKYWYSFGATDGYGDYPLKLECLKIVSANVRAACIAMDAEVATHEVVRAPVKLNEKRAKAGKTPLSDYHIVDLSRRHRIANPSGGESGTRKRLHFVRGHWRHYEEHKSWIKWHLRGNPELGFIQKHYAL